ncbi:MAG TPA: hypothetical protein VKD70_11700 [Candidatus Acidoferrum sp.]|nr:hypothetical protein [Candidatus Acidoferrum sp.]
MGRNGKNGKLARRVHAFLGLVSALNLFILIATGFLLQHASLLKLDEKIISRRILPSSYRPQDGQEGVRADIFVTDLHSGRLLGKFGTVLLDAITLAWMTLLLTGLVMYAGKLRAKQNAAARDSSAPDDE